MTMPTLMNCGHDEKGWCLSCVQALGDKYSVLVQAIGRELSKCTCEEYSCLSCVPLKAALDKVSGDDVHGF